MVRSVCFIVTVLLIANAASAATRFRPHTSADERACGADAHRFCKEDIPDQRIASCLQEHRETISRACRAALEGRGM